MGTEGGLTPRHITMRKPAGARSYEWTPTTEADVSVGIRYLLHQVLLGQRLQRAKWGLDQLEDPDERLEPHARQHAAHLADQILSAELADLAAHSMRYWALCPEEEAPPCAA